MSSIRMTYLNEIRIVQMLAQEHQRIGHVIRNLIRTRQDDSTQAENA